MQFTYDITIPPNTAEDSPTREITKLCHGTLKQIQIDFPWGCAGFARIRILHYEHQLYPTNPTKWFVGNDTTIVFACEYPVTQGWNEFKVEGYNEDDTYDHTPIINFNVLATGVMIPELAAWVEG